MIDLVNPGGPRPERKLDAILFVLLTYLLSNSWSLMPTHDHLVQVARTVRRELDRESKAFMSMDRMQLTQRLREVSRESSTRIKAALGADLERALNDQGLRCYPSLTETTTGDRVRVFRAGSTVGDLIDAVLLPSPDHDRDLTEALAKSNGRWDWDRDSGRRAEASTAELLRRVLSREKQMAYVHSIEDPDLATS